MTDVPKTGPSFFLSLPKDKDGKVKIEEAVSKGSKPNTYSVTLILKHSFSNPRHSLPVEVFANDNPFPERTYDLKNDIRFTLEDLELCSLPDKKQGIIISAHDPANPVDEPLKRKHIRLTKKDLDKALSTATKKSTSGSPKRTPGTDPFDVFIDPTTPGGWNLVRFVFQTGEILFSASQQFIVREREEGKLKEYTYSRGETYTTTNSTVQIKLVERDEGINFANTELMQTKNRLLLKG